MSPSASARVAVAVSVSFVRGWVAVFGLRATVAVGRFRSTWNVFDAAGDWTLPAKSVAVEVTTKVWSFAAWKLVNGKLRLHVEKPVPVFVAAKLTGVALLKPVPSQ